MTGSCGGALSPGWWVVACILSSSSPTLSRFYRAALAYPGHVEGAAWPSLACSSWNLGAVWRARAERINPLVALDAGEPFASTGQIFGRYRQHHQRRYCGLSQQPAWATLYMYPHSFFCIPGLYLTECRQPGYRRAARRRIRAAVEHRPAGSAIRRPIACAAPDCSWRSTSSATR